MSRLTPYKLIQKSFEKRQKEDTQLSLRSLAKQIKISPGYLSKIIAGKKPLNKKLIEELGHYLKMDELQYQQILEAYEQKIIKDKIGQTTKLKTTQQTFSDDIYELLPAQSEWILSKWYYLCVLDLITTSSFKEDPDWIAQSLQIRREDAIEALKSLERAQLIFRNEAGQIQKTYKKLRFPTKMSKEIIRQFHIAQMKRAINLLSSQSSQTHFEKRLVTSLTVATNVDKIKEVKEFLHQALYQAADMLSDGDCQELYQLNLQFFPQSRELK